MLKKQIVIALLAVGAVGAASAAETGTQATCNISPQGLSKWFQSGKPANGGLVTFADSLKKNVTVCDFYKWSHQMFLWVTSPKDGSILLDSPVFYDVNFNSQGNATYVPNTIGVRNNHFALRASKPEHFQPGGQAGGGDTLLSLNGSLVYFAEHANDVFAWFNTAISNNVLAAGTPFPTTPAELKRIVDYAKLNKAKLGDAKALTMELKTAWVDAATVTNLSDYILITADVPNYIGKIGDKSWTISTTQPTIKKTLALVGVHIVGPVAGHPEMVWATFEHRNNAPDNNYYVSNKLGKTKLVPYNSTGNWSFMTNGGQQAGALVSQMTVDGKTGNINATTASGVQPNNVYRAKPWGNEPTVASANNNSQLISLNNDINSMLGKLGDVRSKYFQVGAVWTNNGIPPNSPTDSMHQVGSKLLANTTMETYHQINKNGCFACHYVSSGPSNGTSHLLSPTNIPLVPGFAQ